MTSLDCRRLTPLDLPMVLALDQACFGGLWSQAGYQRELDSPNSDLLVLTVDAPSQSTGKIVGVGCLWAILEEAHITLLGVAPAYRRQGLGQWLLIHLLRSACDRKLTHATLEVRKSNKQARSLYEKFGFQVAGERRRYYPDNEDALILWKSGLQTSIFEATLQVWTREFASKLQLQGWQLPATHRSSLRSLELAPNEPFR
ncbi:MAG: ribosomal protein S18-alanine N-acetyltransferase [Leptolyngbya sp. SIO1E4]|nr:ribosomal protein S18-alanine N-acetyltransferase [Leptolyngbya sp. SIO1E4]